MFRANIIKAKYDKPTANIILSVKRFKVFPLKIGAGKQDPVLPLLFNLVLKVLAREIRQEKEIKSIQIIKGEVKFSLFANHMILYIENLKKHAPKVLELINEFSKIAGYKIKTEIICISMHLKEKEYNPNSQ